MKNTDGLIREITALLPSASFEALEFVFYMLLRWGKAEHVPQKHDMQ